MDDPSFNSKYKKYKFKVKIWEKRFKTKYGRIPSKHDIRDASNDIRYAYKMYYKLKTSILEETLSDILFEDECDGFELSNSMSQSESNFSLSETNLPTSISLLETSAINCFAEPNINTIEESPEKISKVFEAEEHVQSNENVWGKHLSKTKYEEKLQSIAPPKPMVKTMLKPELFESSKFQKRNPRKSLVRGSSITSYSKNDSMNKFQIDQLPDLETILTEKSIEREKISPKHIKYTYNVKPRNMNINEGWLNRMDSINSITKNDNASCDSLNVAKKISQSKNYGISNLNFEQNSELKSNSLSVISDTPTTGISNLNLSSSRNSLTSFTSDSILTSTENIYEKLQCPSDNEIIGNSEDETTSASLHIRKKRKLMIKPTEVIEKTIESPKEEKIIKTKSKRSSERSAKKNQNYSETIETNELDEDPFQNASDSDKDPEFIIETKLKMQKKNTDKSTIKKVLKQKKIITGTTKKIKKLKDLKEKKSSKSKKDEVLDKTDERVQYIPEFGIENVQNVPRIDITELTNTTKLFNRYVINSNEITVAKPSHGPGPTQSLENQTKQAALEAKIKSGKLNENFTRINMKKKIFVRGKKAFNFSRYKKSEWKKKKIASMSGPDMDMGGCDGGVLVCFNCGGVGHFAQKCKVKGDELLPLDVEATFDSPFPSLEEADLMVKSNALKVHGMNPTKLPIADNPTWKNDEVDTDSESELNKIYDNLDSELVLVNPLKEKKQTFIGHQIPEDIFKKSGIIELSKITDNNDKANSMYNLNEGTLFETPHEVFEALKLFGHTSFRSGQEKAIMRILSGKSTLVTLSTGSGKSLCYQLPAYLYARKNKCCTLVISPLVSLMEDQVHGVPNFLNAQCLHTNQTPKVKEKIMDMIKSNNLDVLLISPEAVVASENLNGFGSILRQLPPIAFACIDEAHCVSQWSHNFRPSYLMICRVLKEKLGIKTILGLTATATHQTRQSIINHLGIPDGLEGVISDVPLPDNLNLTVSRDMNRDGALIELIRSERFESCQSIIVYCTRRDECERIAAFLRTCLQEKRTTESFNSKKRKRINWNAEPYHAGLSASRRRTIQNAFMSGDLRIVVATIAFGMGINKADIRAVIHYNMPKSFESYVQEVGRAGRDGLPAECHIFLDSNGSDQNELRRHIYANSIDRHVLRKLLQKIFVPCACGKNKTNTNDSGKPIRLCPGHEVCFSVENTVQLLDIPQENISTLLCYLELHENRYVQILNKAYTMGKVLSYGGARSLRLAAQNCPPLAMAIALDLKKGISHNDSTSIEFPVIEVAAAIGWDSGVVKYQLKNLEWTNDDGYPKRSNISVNYFDLGFRIKAPGDLTDNELDEALDSLYERVSRQERTELIQLQTIFEALSSIAFKTYLPASKLNCSTDSSNKLKTIIRNYFQTEIKLDIELNDPVDDTPDDIIIGDIRTMISRYPENNFTGRTLARIFHGCQSPNYPAVIWGRCKYWRAHLKVSFNRIVLLANSEIVKQRKVC